MDESSVERLGDSFDGRRVGYIKDFVSRCQFVEAIATGEGDESGTTLTDRLDPEIFRVTAEEDRFIGRIIRHCSCYVDGPIDEMPLKLQQGRLACILDQLLVQDRTGKINLPHRTRRIVHTMRCVRWQTDLEHVARSIRQRAIPTFVVRAIAKTFLTQTPRGKMPRFSYSHTTSRRKTTRPFRRTSWLERHSGRCTPRSQE